jgi:hypothetical protein
VLGSLVSGALLVSANNLFGRTRWLLFGAWAQVSGDSLEDESAEAESDKSDGDTHTAQRTTTGKTNNALQKVTPEKPKEHHQIKKGKTKQQKSHSSDSSFM